VNPARPRGSRSSAQAPRLWRDCASVTYWLELKSCPQGQLDDQPYSHSGPGTNAILPGDEGVARGRPNRCSRRASTAQTPGTCAPGTPRTLCLTARVAQPQTVVRMLRTSADAIRGSLAMVDYAAGAGCLNAPACLRAALCAPRVETLRDGSARHEAASRQRPAVADRDGPARSHRSGLGPNAVPDRGSGATATALPLSAHRRFPSADSIPTARRDRDQGGSLPARAGCSSQALIPRPIAPGHPCCAAGSLPRRRHERRIQDAVGVDRRRPEA
jgi:hypothetical protein